MVRSGRGSVGCAIVLPLVLAACGGDGDGGPFDGVGDDDDDASGPPPITRRCADPGPDAPVTPLVTSTTTTFEGDPLLHWIPESPRAVVFYFYGGDAISEWNGPEQTAFANQLVDANIGWVAYTKADREGLPTWDADNAELGTNLDLQRLDRLRAELVATTPLEQGTPIVSVGFSDGAAFSVRFATAAQGFGWPLVSVLVHNSGARGIELPDVPLWATSSDHDEPGTRDGAEDLAGEQAARGFDGVYRRTVERAATADVFLRNPEWDAAKVDEVFQELVDMGLVDATGARLVSDAQLESAIDAYANNSVNRGAAISSARLRVVWATHRYSAAHTAEECEFVLTSLGL